MKGDILVIKDYHRHIAKEIVTIILNDIQEQIKSEKKYTITVAGESGSGKSETAKSIADELLKHEITSYIFQQDDYFIHPPKTNESERRKNIGQVGPGEVKIDLLEKDIAQAVSNAASITKPLVIFEEDKISAETIEPANYQVFIAEGTYTTLLRNIDTKVFINRNKLDTLKSRQERNREKQDAFLEEVLEIEHKIISQHKEKADIIISKDYEIEKNN